MYLTEHFFYFYHYVYLIDLQENAEDIMHKATVKQLL